MTHDFGSLIVGNSQIGGNPNSVFEYSIIDGSDTPEVLADPNCTGRCYGLSTGVYSGPAILRYNVFRYLTSGAIGTFTEFHDNLVEYIRFASDSAHPNGFENNTDPCGGLLFYNNVVRHTVGVNIWMAPQKAVADGGTCADATYHPTYVWNNVTYDNASGNVWDNASALSNPNGRIIVFNNSIKCGRDPLASDRCMGCQSTYASCLFQNNHLISNNVSPVTPCGTNCTQTTPVTQNVALASSQGYFSTGIYAFIPVSASNATVGAGTSLTGLCATISGINATAGIACASDTGYGASYDATNHIVSYPAKNLGIRGSSWDVGAYQFLSQTRPNPPTNLSAVPQ